MYVGYDEDQQALRQELRDYYAELLTPEVQDGLADANGVGPAMRKVVKQMGTDGWLGIGWPEEYGGKNKSQLEQFIFFDESMRAGAPVPMLTINTVGPTIFRYGTDEQKDRFLPQILKGEIHFCIGYTEPGAGTDLAALKTRAVRDGDEYVINGQKIFTSLASDADYCWLAVRTNPDVSKHKGISMIIVPMDTPGHHGPAHGPAERARHQPGLLRGRAGAGGEPVGGENNGWSLITNQLNHERVTLCSSGMLEQTYEEALRYAQETKLADGRRVIDQEWAQLNLARVRAGLEFLRLINWKVAWGATEGLPLDIGDASTIKVFGTEFYLEAFRLLMEVVGPASYLRRESPEALLRSRLERNYRSLIILTFGGGVNEVQRDLIAMFALGLPRADR